MCHYPDQYEMIDRPAGHIDVFHGENFEEDRLENSL
jgi:hypothetical protein